MICDEQQEQGIDAAVLVCADWDWKSILVMVVRQGEPRLEAVGVPPDFHLLRQAVRGWELSPQTEETALTRLHCLERDYRDWRAWKSNQATSQVNWAFVAVMLSAVVFWPLAIFGALKLLGW